MSDKIRGEMNPHPLCSAHTKGVCSGDMDREERDPIRFTRGKLFSGDDGRDTHSNSLQPTPPNIEGDFDCLFTPADLASGFQLALRDRSP